MYTHFYCLTDVVPGVTSSPDADVVYGALPNLVGTLLEQHIVIPTLVIEIYTRRANILAEFVKNVVHNARRHNAVFEQIVFDASFDPLCNHDEIAEILNNFSKESGIRSFLFVSEFELKTHSHLVEINYPCWLVSCQLGQPQIEYTPVKQYKFSCLNKAPRFHRLLTYTLLKRENLLDDFIFSFPSKNPYNDAQIKHDHYLKDVEKLPEEYQYLGDEALWSTFNDFPIAWNNEVLGKNDHSIQHDAYINTYCNLVTETAVDIPFSSEKIWKPISIGQLFLVVGPPGINQWLNSLGFYTFDDDYDSEPEFIKRLLRIVKVIKNRKDNMPDWYNENADKIKHNYELYHSGLLLPRIFEPAIQLLNSK